MLYQLNYIHHRSAAKYLARLKFGRSADLPGASSPAKVPSEEGKPKAKPDSRQGCRRPASLELHPKGKPQITGTPEGTRTPDPLLRRQLLYPPELQARMERVMGIEPTRPAWKAGILPLNYTRMGADLR